MLEFRSVTKRFAKSIGLRQLFPRGRGKYITALDHVSFRCEPGEIAGLVGPNGAGKTTLSRLAVNLLLPDSGLIYIAGENATSGKHKLRGMVSLVSADDRSFFTRLSGRENLEFFLALYGKRDIRPALEMAEYLQLSSRLRHPFHAYSTGMRKKLAIIRGLMTDPRIVILDEATNGLDPDSVVQLRRLITEHCRERAVLWATHRLEEIRDLCTRVMVLRDGALIFDGRPADCGFDSGSGPSSDDLHEAYLSLVSR